MKPEERRELRLGTDDPEGPAPEFPPPDCR